MKKFREFLEEATTDLHPGVTLTKKAPTPESKLQFKGKMVVAKEFDVHLHGHHIGTVRQHVHRPVKKIAGSRLVKPMAERLAWSAHTTRDIETKHGAGFYRSSNSMGSRHQHDAANSLARHYAQHIKG